MDELKRTDPEIYELIKGEERYQIESVRLIPSENYVSKAVLEATGSVLTNKYSEGYPGKRYYRASGTSTRSRRLRSIAPRRCLAPSMQRAAIFRVAGESGGLLCAAQQGEG